MLIQRSIPIILERSEDLLNTVEEFNRYQKGISEEAFNNHSVYTSQTCNQCGLLGNRVGSRFDCQNCGHKAHADINASLNVLSLFAVLRGGGPSSTGPEARASATGKPSPLGEGS